MSLIIFSANVFAQSKKSDKQTMLQTVSSVDLKQYAGKWFEIARYPNKFQKKCVGNTTATYTLKPDGNIEVFNQCLLKNGTLDGATGEAKVVDGSSNSKFEVRFAPKYMSFLSAVWGDYWIVDLDSEYKYAAIGDPKREYLWILSRTPEMNDATYQNILRRVEKLGFNPAKLQKTPQNSVAVKGAVIRKQ
ncbi:MAG: lipocalin family protein [Acidobacteriota bacterium]|nr:lipocalin family protein [Acidobacteriota bacterium]